jgi:hypothetical protein
MDRLIYLGIFHLKVIVCQNVNLSHTIIAPKNTHLWYDKIEFLKWLINLFQSYRITMFNRYYNFMNIKNHFNHVLNIFSFLSMLWHINFWHKYTLTSHHIRLKSVVSLEFNLFGILTYQNNAKILWNSFIIMTWLKFKHGAPKK